MKRGQSLSLKGIIHRNAPSITIDLGLDGSNYYFHFNPRFEKQKDHNLIVCNSKLDGIWGAEHRQLVSPFPFKQGKETLVHIEFTGDNFIVKMSNGQALTFPARMVVNTIPYLNLEGIDMKSISLE
ncbi:galectin-1-like [Discoglossus pictus]